MAASEGDVEVNTMMAVSIRQLGRHTISGNISLFQIHQKLKQGGTKIKACKS